MISVQTCFGASPNSCLRSTGKKNHVVGSFHVCVSAPKQTGLTVTFQDGTATYNSQTLLLGGNPCQLYVRWEAEVSVA